MIQPNEASPEFNEFSDELSDEAIDRAFEVKGSIPGGTVFSTCRGREIE